jgi:ABC-2 type transport system ATP-binding protein
VLLMAALRGARRKAAIAKAESILDALQLTSVASKQAVSLAPNELRRIALAGALVGTPKVLVLDEPTVNLLSDERTLVWNYLKYLCKSTGASILVGTSRLDEAEVLMHRVALLDRGKLIAAGTPQELRAVAGGTLIVCRVASREQASDASALLARVNGVRSATADDERVNLEVAGAGTLPGMLRILEEHEIGVREVTLSRSSLEDVFFQYTGRKIQDNREPATDSTNAIGRR